jgi:hypothetical protein
LDGVTCLSTKTNKVSHFELGVTICIVGVGVIMLQCRLVLFPALSSGNAA